MLRLFSSAKKKQAVPSIVTDLERARDDLHCAYVNFENVLEPDLVDCYIYQLQSAQIRYQFLLNCAKNGYQRKK